MSNATGPAPDYTVHKGYLIRVHPFSGQVRISKDGFHISSATSVDDARRIIDELHFGCNLLKTKEGETMADTMSQSELSLYVSAIAASMGDGWGVRPLQNDDMSYPSQHIDHVDGPSFWLRPDGYGNTKRMEVHGNWPKTSDGREQFPRKDYKGEGGANTITFSLSKTPKDAANDIKRRFLPRYMELRAEMLSQVQSEDSYAAKTQASIKALIATDPAILRQSVYGDKQDVWLGQGYHGSSLRINGDSVRFEHLDVPLSVALQILPLLKCRRTEDDS